MTKTKKIWTWGLWVLGSLMLALYLVNSLLGDGDKAVLMPGPLSDGHHQLVESCDACHADRFGGGEVLQQSCVDCHGDVRVKPLDSHPAAKFKDPRNADRLEKINALACISCHTEHRPEITQKNGLTQPRDLCFHCHSDVAEDRPSHEGMEFNTCTNAGCHNYHDNRALYTNFLIKHLDEPIVLTKAQLPEREFRSVLEELIDYPRDRYPVQPLKASAMDAPDGHQGSAQLQRDWLETAHAEAGVNCSACHLVREEEGITPQWQDKPGMAGCQQCHDLETSRFQQGKHGMRLKSGLSPMTPQHARLPMKQEAAHDELTCNSCHGAHRYDTAEAAVESCLSCHADDHSLAYKASPHYALWQQEQAGELPPGSGVSCASCHMPRVDFDVSEWMSRTMVEHNQSAVQSPNSKMIRPACIHCHGLGFSIDALADPALIERNFKGQPTLHVESMDLAKADKERRDKERGGDDSGMFGF